MQSIINESRFKFQQENESLSLFYRPAGNDTITYNISNISTVPENSFGVMNFIFDDYQYNIPYDARINNIPSGVSHNFNTFNDTICSMKLLIFVSGANYTDYVVLSSITKNVKFTEILPASGFVIYPEFTWNGNDWIQAVQSYQQGSGNILQYVAPLSSYGFSHTENYFLSSNISINDADAWRWSVQDNNGNIILSTYSYTPTTWVRIKTPRDAEYLSISASVFSDSSDINMPDIYFDEKDGSRFKNFESTFNKNITSSQTQHINIINTLNNSIIFNQPSASYLNIPVPNIFQVSGGVTSNANMIPFDILIDIYNFKIITPYWSGDIEAEGNLLNSFTDVNISVDDIGNNLWCVPLTEKTEINITQEIGYSLSLKTPHPSSNDWAFRRVLYNDNKYAKVTASPVDPLIYTSNFFLLTGQSFLIENLVDSVDVQYFQWGDRGEIITETSNAPYISSFDDVGVYDIDLRSAYSYNGIKEIDKSFKNIFNVQDKYNIFDGRVSRVYSSGVLNLPYKKEDCIFPPNEWVTANTFNNVIDKLYDNLTYMESMLYAYDAPPTDYIGWYGSSYYGNNVPKMRWHVKIPYNSYGYNHPEYSIDHIFNDLQDGVVENNNMYISNGTTVYIMSSDFRGTVINSRSYKTIGDNFGNIRSIIKDENKLYLLDSINTSNLETTSKDRILVFNINEETGGLKYAYSWGGTGVKGDENKFNSPMDFCIDKNNNSILVADTGNMCIKKYSRTGSWLQTFDSIYFTETERPISVAVQDNIIFVLTDSQLLKFDNNGIFKQKYDIEKNSKRLSVCTDGGFLYVTYETSILKYSINGVNVGLVTLPEYFHGNYILNCRSAFHDENRNLFVICKNHILKFFDQLNIISLKPTNSLKLWSREDLYVKKDECVQDWVINRCFQRFWENLEIFRSNILGRFDYEEKTTVVTTSMISAVVPPSNFDFCKYDWLYENGKKVTVTNVFSYFQPFVRAFSIEEMQSLPFDKNSIYVGLNELCAADVYNRVISQLYQCENILLGLIQDR